MKNVDKAMLVAFLRLRAEMQTFHGDFARAQEANFLAGLVEDGDFDVF